MNVGSDVEKDDDETTDEKLVLVLSVPVLEMIEFDVCVDKLVLSFDDGFALVS